METGHACIFLPNEVWISSTGVLIYASIICYVIMKILLKVQIHFQIIKYLKFKNWNNGNICAVTIIPEVQIRKMFFLNYFSTAWYTFTLNKPSWPNSTRFWPVDYHVLTLKLPNSWNAIFVRILWNNQSMHMYEYREFVDHKKAYERMLSKSLTWKNRQKRIKVVHFFRANIWSAESVRQKKLPRKMWTPILHIPNSTEPTLFWIFSFLFIWYVLRKELRFSFFRLLECFHQWNS